ncbi:MAG: DUF3883 domain-containing protein [Actinomycetota bacterium]|nr:DUF3883 domain-containing protein [Actinomycetota bacterium]
MVRRSITDANFGAWVLKCNPRMWDLEGWIADGNEVVGDWSVNENYRSELMQPGQPAVLWVTGSLGAKPEPGVWGVGEVIAPPHSVSGGDAYWLDLSAAERVTTVVQLQLPVSGLLVAREEMQADPRLADCEVFRAPQMGNPSWFTREEWAAARRYLGDRAPLPLDAVTRKALRAGTDSGLEPDPRVRALVERAAVDEVRAMLEGEGFSIKDVQKDNVGWDIEATRGSERLLVEVKGTSGRRAVVQLTTNEHRAATVEVDWRLAIVTRALDEPTVRIVGGREAVAAAAPAGYRVDLT